MNKVTCSRSISAAVMATAALCVAREAPAQQMSATESLEEVIVTASKRSERLQDVPSGITALTDVELQNLGAVGFADYMRYVPSLSANDRGIAGQYTVVMRGLTSGAVQLTPTVGYYLDETPITPNAASSVFGYFSPDPDLGGNVERVEVLKGPQATLYGASTLGGLIKIVSKKPDLAASSAHFGLRGSTVDEGSTGYALRGDVNIPIVQDQLGARLAAFYREDPPFTDNVLRNERDVNSGNAEGGRLDLRYAPTPTLDVLLTGLIQKRSSDGPVFEYLDPATLRPISGPNEFSLHFNTAGHSQLDLLSLTANYDAGLGTLTSATSYVSYHQHTDGGIAGDAYDVFLPLFGLAPDATVVNSIETRTRKVTEELRFSSERVGNFEWLLGGFYTDEDVANPGTLTAVQYPSRAAVTSPPGINPFFVGDLNGTYREYAAFGNVTYYVTDALDITAGMRYSRNDQDSESLSQGPLVGGGGPPRHQSFEDSDNNYLVTLRWRPTGSISTYLRAASGYRPGGPQVAVAPGAPTSFEADTNWNYEIGAKSNWLSGTLTANIAYYYIDWRDIQLNVLYGGLPVTGNGGDAKTEGIELDGSYAPIDGLSFTANVAWSDTRMESVNPLNTAGARVGDPLPYTPEWSGGFTANYRFPFANGATGGIGASWLYQGSRYSSFSGDLLNTRVVIPSYSTVGLRGTVDWHNYSLGLHVDNVANEHAYSSLLINRVLPGQAIAATATPIQPRTIWLSVDVRF